ncbi:MAG: hypothetical protein K9N21_19255 [Deltaproteobacteria bacterium]|nr:hypothetical protein [Deltaproteobacteria bacterium]
MEESLMKSLEAIGRFFHLYVITFATYGIIGVIRLLNNRYYKESSPLKFLDMNIYPEYFSLIFGILFFASIIVFHLMYLNFQSIIAHAISTPEGMTNVKMIKYGSWVGSPFSEGKIGPSIFSFMIGLGMLYCIYLTVAHLFFSMPENSKIPKWLYKMIGGFDLVVFAVSVYWFYLWRAYIISIRSKIGA